VSRPRILPAGFIEPCIPTAARVPPAGPGWLHEIKYDGYRLVVRLEGRRVRLFTRRGHEWSDRFPRIREGLASLRTRSSTIDGEAVVLCPKTGLSLFDELLCVTPAGGAPCAADWPVGAGGLDGAAVGAGAAGVVGADAAGGVALGEVGDEPTWPGDPTRRRAGCLRQRQLDPSIHYSYQLFGQLASNGFESVAIWQQAAVKCKRLGTNGRAKGFG
jgi:hypothetical protein